MEQITTILLIITSSAFSNNGMIPSKYTCDGENINPPLHIENIPEATKSLVLIVDDPDAPAGTWDHWVVWDIEPGSDIAENSVPGTEGVNSWHKNKYGGPCCPPPSTHRYFFKIYALDTMLGLEKNSDKKEVYKAMEGHILAKGELMGKYQR